MGDDGSQGGKRLFIFVLKSVAANCPLAVASVVGNGTIIGIRVVVAWAVVGAIKNAISAIHLLQSNTRKCIHKQKSAAYFSLDMCFEVREK